MAYQSYTTDEFHNALMACRLPLYEGMSYIASWLAPDGKILVSGDGHWDIAQCVMTENGWPCHEEGSYQTLYDHGYFRLTPFNKRRSFGMEGRGKMTSKQKASISMFLRLWHIDEQFPGYITRSVPGEYFNKQLHTRADFLKMMTETFK